MRREQLLSGPAVVRGVSLPKALNDTLRERARQEDRPASWIIKTALLRYFQDVEDGREPTMEEVRGG